MVSGVSTFREIPDAIREMREQSGIRAGSRESTFRPSPGATAYYDLNYQIHDQRTLENMWALSNSALFDHPMIGAAISQRCCLSQVMEWGPQPRTGDREINKILKDSFEEHSCDPNKVDVAGKHTFAEMAYLASYLNTLHGDFIAPISPSSQLQVLEAYRCRSPYGKRDKAGFLGVVTGDAGNEISFWVTKRPRSPLEVVSENDLVEMPAYGEDGQRIVLHPMAPNRPGNRGITCLAPFLDLAYIQMDALFAKTVQEMVAACTVFSREFKNPEQWTRIQEIIGKLSPEELKQIFGSFREGFEPRPGTTDTQIPGIELKAVNTGLNPANWEAVNQFLSTMLAMLVDAPLISITMDATGANFSEYRNVMQQARMRYNVYRQWFVNQFHKPFYEHCVRRWASERMGARGKALRTFIRANGLAALFKCVWPWPDYPYMEPMKEIQARTMERAEGHITDQEWCNQVHGLPWEDYCEEMVDGRKLAFRAAMVAWMEMLKEFGTDPDAKKVILATPPSFFLPIPMQQSYKPGQLGDDKPPAKPAAAKGVTNAA